MYQSQWLGLSAWSHKISPTSQTRKYQSWLSKWLPGGEAKPLPPSLCSLGVEEDEVRLEIVRRGRLIHAKPLGCHVKSLVTLAKKKYLFCLRQISIFECRLRALNTGRSDSRSPERLNTVDTQACLGRMWPRGTVANI